MTTDERLITTLEKIESALNRRDRMAYTQIEAASLLGISRNTLRQETQLGHIRRTYHKLYSREELERWLRDGMKQNEFVSRKAA